MTRTTRRVGSCLGADRLRRGFPASRGVGESHPEASRPSMPPLAKPRPDSGTYDAVDRIPRDVARPRRCGTPQSRPDRHDPAAHSNRIPERHPRSPRARCSTPLRSCPPDESSYGFDNVTVGDLSPTLLDRYVSAAEKSAGWRSGRPAAVPWRREIGAARPHAGGAPRGPSNRHPRRCGGSAMPFRWTASTRSRFA